MSLVSKKISIKFISSHFIEISLAYEVVGFRISLNDLITLNIKLWQFKLRDKINEVYERSIALHFYFNLLLSLFIPITSMLQTEKA